MVRFSVAAAATLCADSVRAAGLEVWLMENVVVDIFFRGRTAAGVIGGVGVIGLIGDIGAV